MNVGRHHDPKTRRKNAMEKCETCRKRKLKCDPPERDWQAGEKCKACEKSGEACGPNVRKPAVSKSRRRRQWREKGERVGGQHPGSRENGNVDSPLSSTVRPCDVDHLPSVQSDLAKASDHVNTHIDLSSNPRTRGRRRTLGPKPSENGKVNHEQINNDFAAFLQILQQFDSTSGSLPPSGLEEQETQDARKQLDHLTWSLGRKTSNLLERLVAQLEEGDTLEAENQTLRTLILITHCDTFGDHFPWIPQCKAKLLRKLIKHSGGKENETFICSLFCQLSKVPHVCLTPDEERQYGSLLLHTSSKIPSTLDEHDLLPEGSLTLRNPHPFPAAHQVVLEASLDLLKMVTNTDSQPVGSSNILQQSLLHLAAASGDVKAVEKVLQVETNVNSRDMFHCTPFFYAALNGDMSVLDKLHKAGARVQDRNKFGQSILCAAASAGHYDAVCFLLRIGADPNNGFLGYTTPLYSAAEGGHLGICRILLDNEARANEPLGNGKTAIQIALNKGHGDIASLLMNATFPQPSQTSLSPRLPPSDSFGSWMTIQNTNDDESLYDANINEPMAGIGDSSYQWTPDTSYL